jgi:hypothetical protein
MRTPPIKNGLTYIFAPLLICLGDVELHYIVALGSIVNT